MSKKKIVGIIGGMGPLATCTLLETLIRHTDAAKDQDHIHILVDCNSSIPDRSAAIKGEGPDPVPEMVATGKRLIAQGAELLVMHCNTAHYFYDAVASQLSVPLIHMPMTLAKALAKRGVKKAGVLATEGTRIAGYYDKVLTAEGIETIYPSPECQKLLMERIYDVKAGKDITDFDNIRNVIADLKQQGAENLILGCTEVPKILRSLPEYADVEEFVPETGFSDSTLTVADVLIEKAGYRLK